MQSVVLLTDTIGKRAGENGLCVTFPFPKVLSDPPFGLLPLQLQDALKCQQCHKQFRSKAGLNYHTMAEHATKVHHMQTWAYLLSCLFLTTISLLSFNRPLPSNISLSCLDQHALAELCFTYCHTDPVTRFVKPKGTALHRSRPLGGQKTCVSESIYKHLPYVTNKVSCHWTPWGF